MKTDPVSETFCFLVFRIPEYGQSPKSSYSDRQRASEHPDYGNKICPKHKLELREIYTYRKCCLVMKIFCNNKCNIASNQGEICSTKMRKKQKSFDESDIFLFSVDIYHFLFIWFRSDSLIEAWRIYPRKRIHVTKRERIKINLSMNISGIF
jgi:hypothetical protein